MIPRGKLELSLYLHQIESKFTKLKKKFLKQYIASEGHILITHIVSGYHSCWWLVTEVHHKAAQWSYIYLTVYSLTNLMYQLLWD